MKSKKSQIAIFIIVSILIILLIIFLFKLYYGNRTDEVVSEEIIDGGPEVSSIKSVVDECLGKQLKRATIISGLRGGFIYDDGEYFLGGAIPDESYSSRMISNLGLNWNNLQSKVLVHSQAAVFQPGFFEDVKYNDDLFYEHSISSDMSQYMTIEFMKCLDFSDFEKKGFNLTYVDYLGEITGYNMIDSGRLEVSDFDAEVGDKVHIYVLDDVLQGHVDEVIVGGDKYVLKFDDLSLLSLQGAETIKNLDVLNYDKRLNLSLDFSDDDIVAKIIYEINIKTNDNRKMSFKESTVNLNVRYKGLMEIAKVLMNYKYGVKKDVDYTDENVLISVLNDYAKGSEYFKYLENKDFKVKKRILKDEQEHKQFVYSIIDDNSKILGFPFVLNFAYENIAPKIEANFMTGGFNFDENNNVIYLFAKPDEEVSYDLRKFFDEFQYKDYYTFYFIEQNYDGSDSKFVLSEEGNLKFTAYQDKVYTFDIEVTDGEASRNYVIYFVTGLPNNFNNEDASRCIKFSNNEDSEKKYPVEKILRKSFSYEEEGYSNLFAYQVIPLDSSVIVPKSTVSFSKACIFDFNQFDAKVSFSADGNSLGTQNFDFGTSSTNSFSHGINVPQVGKVVEVKVDVFEKGRADAMTETFVLKVYPTNCLGPFPSDDYSLYGGDFTCCNLGKLYDFNLKKPKLPPKSFIASDTNIYKASDNHKAFNAELYFALDTLKSPFNFEENVVWNIDEDITSLFSSEVSIVCKGVYSNPVFNFDGINEGDFTVPGQIENVYLYGEELGLMNNVFKVDFEDRADMCEFGYFREEFPLSVKLSNGLLFKTGLVSRNKYDSGVSTLSNIDEDVFILCDNSLYTSPNGAYNPNSWVKGGSNRFESNGYCYQNTDACSGRPGSPSFY